MCKHYAPPHEQQGLELERIGDVGMYVVGNGSGGSSGRGVVRCSWASALRTFGLWGVFFCFLMVFLGRLLWGVRHPDSIPLGTHSCWLVSAQSFSCFAHPEIHNLIAVCFPQNLSHFENPQILSLLVLPQSFLVCSSKQKFLVCSSTYLHFVCSSTKSISFLESTNLFVVCSCTIFFLFANPHVSHFLPTCLQL